MVKLRDTGVYLTPDGREAAAPPAGREESKKHTIAYQILKAHNLSGDMKNLRLTFDSLVSPDNNYVNILQTARASGLKRFPVPYVLSNCHHTLCAVGGTINEDDHVFGLDNAKRYGGIFLAPYGGVLHQYMRERMAGCGRMILGSDSHTRYGALGTMGIGEGGGEVVKQLLGRTYDIPAPPVVAVKLTGRPRDGVGPMDVALALIGAVFRNGFVKNKVLEFLGDGIGSLSVEYRMGVDVMMTESAALSSVWCTDGLVEEYLQIHKRGEEYKRLAPAQTAYYDGMIELDLSEVEPMMALPFHPSHVVPIRGFQEDPYTYLKAVEEEGCRIKGGGERFAIMDHIEGGRLRLDQALVSGCAGGMFENIAAIADILDGCSLEGGGILMDARSIAATVRNGGYLTAATELEVDYSHPAYEYDPQIYKNLVFDYFGKADPAHVVRLGPNIADWPEMAPMGKHLLLQVAGSYEDSVTTDELIPSGDASSYRSNPEKISDYTMISRDPEYVGRAKQARELGRRLREEGMPRDETGTPLEAAASQDEVASPDGFCRRLLDVLCRETGCSMQDITVGSIMIAHEIGDGSSREQAASCQRVLGGFADLANVYATKRYRSNLLNWGLLPLQTDEKLDIPNGAFLWIEDVKSKVMGGQPLPVKVMDGSGRVISCAIGTLTEEEKEILLSGCLMNYYRNLKE